MTKTFTEGGEVSTICGSVRRFSCLEFNYLLLDEVPKFVYKREVLQ